jgi:hypothetical protein
VRDRKSCTARHSSSLGGFGIITTWTLTGFGSGAFVTRAKHSTGGGAKKEARLFGIEATSACRIKQFRPGTLYKSAHNWRELDFYDPGRCRGSGGGPNSLIITSIEADDFRNAAINLPPG